MIHTLPRVCLEQSQFMPTAPLYLLKVPLSFPQCVTVSMTEHTVTVRNSRNSGLQSLTGPLPSSPAPFPLSCDLTPVQLMRQAEDGGRGRRPN